MVVSHWTGRSLTVVLFVCALTAGAFVSASASAAEADDVYAAFRSKYIDGGNAVLQFQDVTMTALSGELTLGGGDRFRLDLGARAVICDGKTVWNYDSLGSKVVINKYKGGRGVLTPAAMFTFFAQKGELALTHSTSSTGARMYIIEWNAQDPDDSYASLQKIVLHLDESTLQPLEVNATDGITQFHWRISGIRKLERADDSLFSFTPGEGTRVIDLR